MSSRRRPSAFTVIELMVVVGVVGILAGLILPMLAGARREARRKNCASNLRQIGQALHQYQLEDPTRPDPPWLHYLVDKNFLTDARIFLCPSDWTDGAEGGKPSGHSNQFPDAELEAPAGQPWDPANGVNRRQNGHPSSYLYETSMFKCEYIYNYGLAPGDPIFQAYDQNQDGVLSWAEVKYVDREGIAGNSQFPPFGSKAPFLRCFWHQPRVPQEPHRLDMGVINCYYTDARVYDQGYADWKDDRD